MIEMTLVLIKSKLSNCELDFSDAADYWEQLARDLIKIIPNNTDTSLLEAVIDYAIDYYASRRQPLWTATDKSLKEIEIEVEKWHKKVQENDYLPENLSWKNDSSIKAKKKGIIEIKELTTAKALTEEGQILDHCVGSYATRVSKNENHSIWSLTMNGKKIATAEVLNKRVVQFLGYRNRYIRESHLNNFMREWEKENNLLPSRVIL